MCVCAPQSVCVCDCKWTFFGRNERKIYDFAAKMRASFRNGTAQTNGLFAVAIHTEHIDSNNDDCNDSPTSLATLPTLPQMAAHFQQPTIYGLSASVGFIIIIFHDLWHISHSHLVAHCCQLLVQLTSMKYTHVIIWEWKRARSLEHNWCTENWFVCKRPNIFVKIKTSFFHNFFGCGIF